MKNPVKLIRDKDDKLRPKGKRRGAYLTSAVGGTVGVSAKPGYVNFKMPVGSSGRFEYGEARVVGGIAEINDLAVQVEEDTITGERIIIGVDAAGNAASGSGGTPTSWMLPDHAPTHEWNGRDMAALRHEQLIENRLEPNAAAQTVTIREGPYLYNGQIEWLNPATSADLSAYYPTSGSKFVWISLGAAGAVTVTDDSITDPELLVYPADGTYVIGWVQLHAAKQLIEWADLRDAQRYHFPPVHIPNPTARGDMLRADASLLWERFAKGTQYQALTGGATDPTWGAIALDQATAISGHLLVANMPVFDKPRLKASGIFTEFNTIQGAINAITASTDEVWIPEGTWNEYITPVGVFTTRLLGCGKRENVIITSTGDPVTHATIWGTQPIYLQNLTIVNTHANGTCAISSNNVSIRDCDLSSVKFGVVAGTGNVYLENCDINADEALLNNSGTGASITMRGGTVTGATQLWNIVAGGPIYLYDVKSNVWSGTGTPTYGEASYALHQISGYTADATPDPAADYIVTLDATDGVHKKVLPNNLFSQAGLLDGSLTTPRIPYASDANTLVDAAEMTWNNTGKFINLNTNIWGIGETVLDLDFTGTGYDTAAKCGAVGVKFGYTESTFRYLIPGTMVCSVTDCSWTHSAGNGWAIESATSSEGPAIYIPLMRPGNWEIEIQLDMRNVVADAYSFFVGYLAGSNHVGAYIEMIDNNAAAVSYTAQLATNDGDDTYTVRYTGSALTGAAIRTIKMKMESSVVYVWNDQDDAWHAYNDRQNVGHAYSASGLFVQAVYSDDAPTVYLSRLILKYLL